MSTHILHHFERDIASIKTNYVSGETSKVYSTFMKMLIQTKTLYEELDIHHPHIPNPPKETTCLAMM
jgi:hypothetical protein